MRHFMEHGRRYLCDGPINLFGADVDFAVCLALVVPDFIDAAPAVSSAPTVGRYGDGRASELALIEVRVEHDKHEFGFLYNFDICCKPRPP